MSKNKKANLALTDLLSRQNYLVVQGNDLAKSFGGLKSFAISGNETFKTISFNTLKKDKTQSQIKIWLCRKFDCE